MTLGLGLEHLLAQERAIVALQRRRGELIDLERGQQAELRRTHEAIVEASQRVRQGGREPIELGDLNRVEPISPVWGLDRGLPIDRYYIEAFLARHSGDIRGRVLEVKDAGYTRRFGADRVSVSDVVDIDPLNPLATIVADLSDACGISSESYDCFILTQTLGVIWDVPRALFHACRVLRPGGVLLCTLPAAGRLSYEEGLDGDYWRFTEASVRRLFRAAFSDGSFHTTGFGNVLVCAAFLYGLSAEDLHSDQLNAVDPYFPLVYAVRAEKRAPQVRLEDDGETADARGAPNDPGEIFASGQSRETEEAAVASCQLPKHQGLILLYHRVREVPSDSRGRATSPDRFREHMRWLRAEWTPLSLAEFVAYAREGRLPDRAVSVTCDDGYADAITTIAPILAAEGIPGTFFIDSSGGSDGGESWDDTLERLLTESLSLPNRLRVDLGSGVTECDCASAEQRRGTLMRISRDLRRSSASIRRRVLDQIVEWAGGLIPKPSRDRRLSDDEIELLSRLPGCAIGSHTANHLWLPDQSPLVQWSEMTESKRRLERITGNPVDALAYPYGAFDDLTVTLARVIPFTVGLTVVQGVVTTESDCLQLPRVEVPDGTLAQLSRTIARVLAASD